MNTGNAGDKAGLQFMSTFEINKQIVLRMTTKIINWGMIGAGDVTEVKSGPAFQKVEGSHLLAVMRRDEEKVKDYALRHNVPKWLTDAQALIEDPEINAIYIATPPDTHDTYAIAALEAGKDVYVEKPMVLSVERAQELAAAVHNNKGKLSVAHYRRQQPYFKKIKALLEENTIGKPQMVLLQFASKPLTEMAMQDPKIKWRLDPGQSGGGLFHDLAPHQIDLMYYFFGTIKDVCGISHNQTGSYKADDVVAGQILFQNDLLFNGTWTFKQVDGVPAVARRTGRRHLLVAERDVGGAEGCLAREEVLAPVTRAHGVVLDRGVRVLLLEAADPRLHRRLLGRGARPTEASGDDRLGFGARLAARLEAWQRDRAAARERQHEGACGGGREETTARGDAHGSRNYSRAGSREQTPDERKVTFSRDRP